MVWFLLRNQTPALDHVDSHNENAEKKKKKKIKVCKAISEDNEKFDLRIGKIKQDSTFFSSLSSTMEAF